MLEGKITALRAIEKKDLPTLLEWRNKESFRKFFREFRELNSDNQNSWYEKTVMNDKATVMFAIIERESGQLLGAAGVCYIDWVNRNADFSIYIGHNDLYIDDNFAVDAAKILISYAFNELNLHRLWAEIYDIDERKKIFFSTLDFQLEGRHKQAHWTGGKWCDSLFYALLSDR